MSDTAVLEQERPKTPFVVRFTRATVTALDGPDKGKSWYITAGMVKENYRQNKRRRQVARGARKRKLR